MVWVCVFTSHIILYLPNTRGLSESIVNPRFRDNTTATACRVVDGRINIVLYSLVPTPTSVQ